MYNYNLSFDQRAERSGSARSVDNPVMPRTARASLGLCYHVLNCGNRRAEVFHDPYTHGRTQVSPTRMAATINETVASLPDVQVCVDETELLSDLVITR